MSEQSDTFLDAAWQRELDEWRRQQRETRQARLLPVRNTIVSALFDYPQHLHELREIVTDVAKLTIGYTTLREDDFLNSILDLTETGMIRLIHEGSRTGQFELMPNVTSSSWELPEA